MMGLMSRKWCATRVYIANACRHWAWSKNATLLTRSSATSVARLSGTFRIRPSPRGQGANITLMKRTIGSLTGDDVLRFVTLSVGAVPAGSMLSSVARAVAVAAAVAAAVAGAVAGVASSDPVTCDVVAAWAATPPVH